MKLGQVLPHPPLPSDSFPSLLQPSPILPASNAATSPQGSPIEYDRLAEYVQLMQSAFDHVPKGILVADSEKRLRFANQAACNALEYTREELQTLSIPDIAPNHDNEKFRQHLDRLRQGHALSYTSVHCTKHGQLFPIEITVHLHNFQGQEFICAITRRRHVPKEDEPS